MSEVKDLVRKWVDECVRELDKANRSSQHEYAEDIVFVEHRLQNLLVLITKRRLK